MNDEIYSEELLTDCLLLRNEDFVRRYPTIYTIASFLHRESEISYEKTGAYEAFDSLGVTKTSQYLSLLGWCHPQAVRLYEGLEDIFGIDDY